MTSPRHSATATVSHSGVLKRLAENEEVSSSAGVSPPNKVLKLNDSVPVTVVSCTTPGMWALFCHRQISCFHLWLTYKQRGFVIGHVWVAVCRITEKIVCRFFWVDRLSEKNFNINFSLVICISLNQPLWRFLYCWWSSTLYWVKLALKVKYSCLRWSTFYVFTTLDAVGWAAGRAFNAWFADVLEFW